MQNSRLYKLTLKQELFCQAFTSNRGNAAAAYRDAYNAGKMKPPTVYVKACTMLKQDKIRARLQEIMEPEIAKFAISRRGMMEQLLFTAESGRMRNNAVLAYTTVMRLMRVCLFK